MLKLTDIRKELPFNVNYNSSLAYLRDLIGGKYKYEIDFDVWLPTKKKNLQRPLVWTLFQKQQLVLSVLKGITLAPLTIIDHSLEDKDRTHIYRIIDGKQRLSTLISFVRNEFAVEVEGVEYFFNDLDEQGQKAFTLLRLHANIGYEYSDDLISDDNKIAWFEMINFAGTAQDIEHLNYLKS